MILINKYIRKITIHHIFALLRLIVAIIGGLYSFINRETILLNVFLFIGILFVVFSLIVIYVSLWKSAYRERMYAISGYVDIGLMMVALYWDQSLESNIYFATYLLIVMHSLYFGLRFSLSLLFYGTVLYLAILGNTILKLNLFDFSVRMASGISLTFMVGFLSMQIKNKTRMITNLNKRMLREIQKKEKILSELREKNLTIDSLYSFSQLISSITDTREIFKQVIDFVSNKMKDLRFSILVKSDTDWRLAAVSPQASIADRADVSCFGVSLAGQVEEQGNIILLNNQPVHERGSCWFRLGSESHHCEVRCVFTQDKENFDIYHSNKLILPIMVNGKIFSSLIVISPSNKEFSGNEINFFKSLTNQMSLALEKAVAFKKLRQSSETDPLTGVYNRRKLMDIAAKSIESAIGDTDFFSLIFIDLDHFKSINDSYGHQTGDLVLLQIANKIEKSLRATDIVGRYGGEEFVILLNHTTKDQATSVAEKIRLMIKQLDFPLPEKKTVIKITISCGVACFPKDANNLDDLFCFADKALYQAKQQGRNQVVVYSVEDEDKKDENKNQNSVHPIPYIENISSWFDDIFRYIENPFQNWQIPEHSESKSTALDSSSKNPTHEAKDSTKKKSQPLKDK